MTSEPYIAWVKEGRKYDLGVVLVTQQPGSIPAEILSQGDNWFLFHMLSAGDLGSVKRANAHFSDDLLGALLNEPIQGQGVFWSSVGGKPYPVALRALSFEKGNAAQDPDYDQPAADTFALSLKERFRQALGTVSPSEAPQAQTAKTYVTYSSFSSVSASKDVRDVSAATVPHSGDGREVEIVASGPSMDTISNNNEESQGDPLTTYKRRAIEAFGTDANVQRSIRTSGLSWSQAAFFLEDALPTTLDNRGKFAYNLVRGALIATFGPEPNWETFKNDIGKVMIRVVAEERGN